MTPSPVDWDLAARIARRVAGREPLERSYHARVLERDFELVTSEAEDLVADFTGLRSAVGPARALVLDRGQWTAANLVSFERLLAPITDRMAAKLAASPAAGAARKVAGAEIGMLVGMLAQRVLGQYDLLVPDERSASGANGSSVTTASAGADGDAVYYVGPNVLGLEKRFAFRPREFRRWIALHEITHRAQFTGVPWMRPYFLGLVDQSLAIADPDPKRLVRALERALSDLRRRRNPLDDGGLVSLFASPDQRVVLDNVQALMSMLEGHGNLVMDRLGAVHVHGQTRMSEALRARREQGGLTRQIYKALGLEMKMRQYEVGERFCSQVVDLAGLRALDAAWTSPEHLPTLDEFTAPERWLARVDSVGSTPARLGGPGFDELRR